MIPDLSSARWHLHQLDLSGKTATLLQLDEAAYRQASFLDKRVEPLAQQRLELKLNDVLNALPSSQASERYIFHIGHCGSTLLSRALAASPDVLPLREPLTLRLLAAEQSEAQLLNQVASAHSRVFRPSQHSIIKATSTCNRLIQPVLARTSQARAILIYLPLESYLAGMLGKLTPASDLENQASLRIRDWQEIPGSPMPERESMADWQLAALGWMSSMYFLTQAVAAHPEQTLLLNFELLLADPANTLSRCSSFLGLESEIPVIQEGWPDISTSYSKKPDEAYSAFNRNLTLQRGRMLRVADIHQAMEWVQRLTGQIDPLQGCNPYFN